MSGPREWDVHGVSPSGVLTCTRIRARLENAELAELRERLLPRVIGGGVPRGDATEFFKKNRKVLKKWATAAGHEVDGYSPELQY